MRIPNVYANKNYQLEEMLLSLNKKGKISATILGVGLIYGKDNDMLQSDVLNALGAQNLQVFGQGNNIIPSVHI